MARPLLPLVAFCACLGAAGCSDPIARSEPATGPAEAEPEPGGLVYALPVSLIRVEASESKGVVTYAIASVTVADPAARFRLRYRPSVWRADGLSVTVNEGGLLHTVSRATVQDQRGTVLVQLARAAGAAAGRTFGLESLQETQRIRPPAAPRRYPFTVFLTPEKLASGGNGGTELPDGARLSVSWPPRPEVVQPAAPATLPSEARCPFSLCYRTVVPVVAQVTLGGRASSFLLPVIDPTRTEGVDLRSAALVERKDSMIFSNGLLTTYDVTKPSTAAAVAGLPADLLTAFFKAVGQLLTIRVDNATAQGDLLEQQARILEQLRLIEERQRALATQRATGAAAQP